MMRLGMGRGIILINLHSFVDLITNSSTELYIIDLGKCEAILVEIIKVLSTNLSYSETSIQPWEDYRYKDEYIIPDGTDLNHIYVCDIDHNDDAMRVLIEKFFTVVKFKYRDDA